MARATVTAFTGPGRQVTALVLEDVKSISFDFVYSVINVQHGNKQTGFQYSDISGVTFTPDGDNTEIVITNA